MKPFLILQLRPEDEAADNEYEAFLRAGNLTQERVRRIRMNRQDFGGIRLRDYAAVIVGGGPYCVSDRSKPLEQTRFESQLHDMLKRIIVSDFPYLGACYGLGILAHTLGGIVSKEKYGEPVAAVTICLNDDGRRDPLAGGITPQFRAFGGHKEACQDVPPGATLLAGSTACPVQMIRVKHNIYGTQFHPELDNEGLALRINTYRHAGYFDPDEADELIAAAADEHITEPAKIFRAFVEAYA